MKLIYVASPYAGDVEQNVEFAKEACRFVMDEGHTVRVTSAEVTRQTSSAAHLTGGTSSPFSTVPRTVELFQPPAGFGYEEATKVTSPLGEQEGNMGRTESSPMRRTVSGANHAIFEKIACALQEAVPTISMELSS